MHNVEFMALFKFLTVSLLIVLERTNNLLRLDSILDKNISLNIAFIYLFTHLRVSSIFVDDSIY